jgi:hypothetical protein
MQLLAPIFNRFIFYPQVRSTWREFTPARVGCACEDIRLDTDDGLQIAAWYLPARQPGWELLFLHGNAGDRGDWFPMAAALLEIGCSVLLLDYRGYGGNPGRPNETGLLLDGEAAWRWLAQRQQESGLPVAVFGKSLGSGVAAHLAARFDPQALILDSAYTTMDEVVHGVVPFIPRRLVPRSFDTLARAAAITCPVLLLHGEQDNLIPLRHSERLYQALNGAKALVSIAQAGHNDLTGSLTYQESLAGFLLDPPGFIQAQQAAQNG